MEFKFDIKDLAEGGEIVKVDHSLTPFGYEEDEEYGPTQIAYNTILGTHENIVKNIIVFYSLQRRVAMIIDEMGKASARAQDLKMPITTAEKLSKSDHTIYLMSEQAEGEYVH